MDLRQLEYVVAVAETGGFTTGARAAHVAQPSLSARIRDLERELGVELFHRVGRGVRVSPAGEVVIDRARLVLREVAAVRAAAASVAGLEAGAVDVAALPTLAVDPLAAAVGRFRAAHPQVVVRVTEADATLGAGGVAALVRSGRAELGLGELPVQGLITVPLGDQELFAIGRSLPASLPRAALGRMPLILTPPGTSTRRVVDEALGHEPVVAVEVDQREAIVPLVLEGAGVGFVPRAQARAAAAQGASVARVTPRLIRTIGLLHRTAMLSPAGMALLATFPHKRATRSGR